MKAIEENECRNNCTYDINGGHCKFKYKNYCYDNNRDYKEEPGPDCPYKIIDDLKSDLGCRNCISNATERVKIKKLKDYLNKYFSEEINPYDAIFIIGRIIDFRLEDYE